MRKWEWFSLLLGMGILLLACRFFQPQAAVVEVTRIVKETVITTSTQPELTFQVSKGVELKVPRTWHTATHLNDGRILLVGGSNGIDDHYSIVEIFDPESRQITTAAPLHTPRHEHTAILLMDNRVLVVGGYNYRQQWLADAEIYDPSTNTWAIVPPIFSHGVQHTATRMKDGRVLVVGGCTAGGICTDRVEIYDPVTNSWLEAAHLAAHRASHSAVLLDDGRVLVAGGAGPQGMPTDGDALLYDPLANSWTATGPKVWPRVQAQMLKLLDGRVFEAGGLSVSEFPDALASCEIYNPASNAWEPAANLSVPRYAFTLMLLPEGQLVAVGGAREYDYTHSRPWSPSSFVQELEIFDPQWNRWYTAGTLPKPVTYAAVDFLPDGSLWVTGGGAGHAVATAWADTWMIKYYP